MDIESRVYFLKPATLYRRTFYTKLHPLFTQQAACTPTRQAVCIKSACTITQLCVVFILCKDFEFPIAHEEISLFCEMFHKLQFDHKNKSNDN